MLKNKLLFCVISLSALFFNGCSEKQPDNSTYIPEGAGAVMSIRLGDLMAKMDYEKALDSEIGDEIFRELRGAPKIIRKTIKDPSNLGLDLYKPVLLFMDNFEKQGKTYHEAPTKVMRSIIKMIGDDKLSKKLSISELKNKYDLIIDPATEERWNFEITYEPGQERYDDGSYYWQYRTIGYQLDSFYARSTDKMEHGKGKEIRCYDPSYDLVPFYGYGHRRDLKEPGNFGIIAFLGEDRTKFESKYDMVLDLIPDEINVKEIKNDKMRYFYIEEDPEKDIDVSIAVGFNDGVAVLLLHNKDEYEENWVDNISSILKGESKNNIISTKPGFTDIYNFDIGIWNDLSWSNDLKDLLTESEPDDEMVAYLKDLPFGLQDNYLVFGAKSDIGNINFSFKSYVNDEIQKIYSEGLFKNKTGNDLVGKFPEDPVAGFGISMNIKPLTDFILSQPNDEIMEFKSDVRKETGLSLDEIISIPKGNVFAALYDLGININRYGGISPDDIEIEAVIGIGIDDTDLFTRASKKITQSDLSKDPLPLDAGFTAFLSGNNLFISSQDYEKGLRDNTYTNQTKNKLNQDLGSSNLYAFVDLKEAIDFLPRDNNDIRRIKTVLREMYFDFIDFGLSADGNSVEIFTNIKFNSQDKNPLSLIIEAILDNIVELLDLSSIDHPEMEAYKCDNPNCNSIHYRPVSN